MQQNCPSFSFSVTMALFLDHQTLLTPLKKLQRGSIRKDLGLPTWQEASPLRHQPWLRNPGGSSCQLPARGCQLEWKTRPSRRSEDVFRTHSPLCRELQLLQFDPNTREVWIYFRVSQSVQSTRDFGTAEDQLSLREKLMSWLEEG